MSTDNVRDQWFEDHITALEEEQAVYRKHLTLFQNPSAVVTLSLQLGIQKLKYALQEVLTHKVTLFLVCPLLLLYFIIPNARNADLEYLLYDVGAWMVLGVMSSIGFGTGLHTGMLFMFPHIYLTIQAVEECGNYEFLSYGPDRFKCIEGTDTVPISFAATFMKTFPWIVAWGVGTAFGEIPPYLLAYKAALSGKIIDDTENNAASQIIQQVTDWMIRIIEKFGFWGVFLFSAYPNAAFDLCGMACGRSLMPMWTFLSATVLGKGVVKVAGQNAFWIAVFSGDTISFFLSGIGTAIPMLAPAMASLEKVILHSKSKIVSGGISESASVADATTAFGYISSLISPNTFGAIFVFLFVKSTVDDYAAQERQNEVDEPTPTS